MTGRDAAIALTTLLLLTGCIPETASERKPMQFRSIPATELGAEVVRHYTDAPPAPTVAALRFEVETPVREGNELVFTGHLTNPANEPVSFIAMLGPFGVQPIYENGLDWKPPWPGFPPPVPAPPPPARITVPPVTDVVYILRYDLRTLAYQGAPKARFHWYYNFLSRPGASGTIEVHLPPATEENRPVTPDPAQLRQP